VIYKFIFFLKNLKKYLFDFYPYHLFRYKMSPYINYKINEQLTFGKVENIFFKKKLSNSKFYVEFGSGHSTFFAKKLNKSFLSVESDKNFYNYMEKFIKERLLFVDFGVVKWFSYPFNKINNKKNAYKYANMPLKLNWRGVGGGCSIKRSPLLVLIDGRYRVLCGLFLYKYFHKSKFKFTFIFDDYFNLNNYKVNRPHYKTLEKFFFIKKVGRFAVTNKTKNCGQDILSANIIKYSIDPR
jgi:hypothetical protein